MKTSASNSQKASTWWPVNKASITGIQPFKGVLDGWDVNDYSMYWQVDGGQLNIMPTNMTDAPHKEVSVDVSNWSWQPDHTYAITYVAKNNSGDEISRTTFSVNVPTTVASQQAAAATVTPSSAPVSKNSPVLASLASSTTTPIPMQATVGKPLQSLSLFVDPASPAKQQADSWRSSRPSDAAQMDKIASQAEAKWFGGWNGNLGADVSNYVNTAATRSQLPVLVAYNIPQRDCGGYSGGGTTPDEYVSWIKTMAAGIGNHHALVILEPDSLANVDCLNSSDQATRYSLISQAVATLKANSTTHVYLDAGNPHWKSADVMASRLKQAGIAAADGFSLNVSNFYTTAENTAFGQAVAAGVGNKHFVIDTSRNGAGATGDGQWCNPSGRALGELPTTAVNNPLIDAYLWIKTPGESDGNCNGGPSAGQWWGDYALSLAQRAAY